MKPCPIPLKTSVITLLTCLLPALCPWATGAQTSASAVDAVIELDRPLVIGHRGYCGIAPENTLVSFSYALAAGADLVELDYHLSSDGVAVVIHDSTLDRTTDAVERWGGENLKVDAYPAAELDQLEAGKWFGAEFSGTPLPRLEAALDLIKGQGGITLIERKAGEASACAALLRERDLINEVVVQSFDWDFVTELHALVPEQVLGAIGPPRTRDGVRLSYDERSLSIPWIEGAIATGARALVWNRQVNAEMVSYAHRHGLKVWIYTINDAAEANWLLDLGVDGLITNHPSLIWRALAERFHEAVEKDRD